MSRLIAFDIDGTLTQTYHSKDNIFLRSLAHVLDFPAHYNYERECLHLTDSAVMDFMFERFQGRLPTETEVQRMQTVYL